MTGVSAIIHGASPVNFSLTDPKEVISPAVDGATGILRSALEYAGSQLQSFIFISSGAAIVGPTTDPEYVFTETDWNNYAEKVVEKLGENAPGQLVYNASKTAAERSVWEFQKQNKVRILTT